MPVYPLTAERRVRVLAALARLAADHEPPRVVDERQIGHDWAPVTRLTFERTLPGIGRSVVVKTRRVEDEGHGGPAFLRREAAGLRTAAASGIAARLLAVDDPAGITVQSDLGGWPTLQDRLLARDSEAATAGMLALASAVGRLHAATLDHAAEHRETLDGFAGEAETGAFYAYDPSHWRELERACDDVGLPSARPARENALALLARVAEPGRCAALVHLDLNPTNVLVTDEGARLVDFESARIGHTGIDTSFLHYPFPHHSNPWGVLPSSVVEAADQAYRRALGDNGGARLLDGYDQRLADGAAIPLIGRLLRLPMVASADQAPDLAWRRRGQIVAQLRTYAGLADRAGTVPAFAGWVRGLEAAMVARWPDALEPPAPLFPAYARTDA